MKTRIEQIHLDTLQRLTLNLVLSRGLTLQSADGRERPALPWCAGQGFKQSHLAERINQHGPGLNLEMLRWANRTPHQPLNVPSVCLLCQYNLDWTDLKSLCKHENFGTMDFSVRLFSVFKWTVLCFTFSTILLHFPTVSAYPYGVEGGRKKNVRREEGEARSMTKAYSGRALESFRVPVNASSFGQADRKEKRRLLGTRQTRGEEEKADSQTGREQRYGEKEKMWKKARVALILLEAVDFNIEFHRCTTHSLNVF